MEKIKLKVTTKSNLLIGGTPSTFEIGGIDLYTATDYRHRPFIPAASWKGALRRIVRDMVEQSAEYTDEIAEAYKSLLLDLYKQNKKQMEKVGAKIETDRKLALEKRFETAVDGVSPEYLFGIAGFNDMPKLIFNDLTLAQDVEDLSCLFSVDTKNQIQEQENEVTSNPRTYKTVRPGISFTGEILLYRLEELGLDRIKEFIERVVLSFNQGIYRLGNSQSRGYGRIQTEIMQERNTYGA